MEQTAFRPLSAALRFMILPDKRFGTALIRWLQSSGID
jgi:hypothetical protein